MANSAQSQQKSALSIQPTSASAVPSEAVMQQAAEWFALLRSGEASEADRLQWQQWCSSAPSHQQAWGFVDAMSLNMQSLQQVSEPRALGDRLLVANQRVLRRRSLLGATAVLGTGALSAWLWKGAHLSQTMLAWAADQRTGTGEIRRIALPDQAELWLNTASAINIDYNQSVRRLELVRGEVLIRTAPDAAQRPFVVDTRDGRMQALGTRFLVSLQEGATQVAVYEGAVGVQVGLDSAQSGSGLSADFTREIQAGERASFDQQRMLQVGVADASEPSWPSGVLQVQDMRLQDLVARLEPYWHGHIGVADDVAELRVFGSFPLHDIPASLAVLENAVPVRIEKTLPWWIRVQGR